MFINAQKKMLVKYVDKFSICNLHSIFQIIKNCVVEIIKYFIGKH